MRHPPGTSVLIVAALAGTLVPAGAWAATAVGEAAVNATANAAADTTVITASAGLLTAKLWSPYLAGGLMGVLSWLTFLFSDQRIGVSTAFVQTAGMIERAAGAKVENTPYYAKNMPFVDWGWLFVAGLVIGALVSALTSGDFAWRAVPALWAKAVSPSALVRWVTAFAGGVLAGFGARWAGGCTSGHGISGTLQLTAISWLAVVCFFVGGMLSIRLVF